MTILQPLFIQRSIRFLFLLLLCSFALQSISAQQVKKSLYLQKYRSPFLGFGPRFINTDPGTIATTFVDDSPSMDRFNSNFDVEDSYFQVGVQLGYKFGRYRGLSHDILLDFGTSRNYQIFFGYSIGWNFLLDVNGKNLLIRPALQGFAMNQVFQLGQIENNAAFIQIDDRQYFEEELDIELRADIVSIAPRLDITYVFAERFDVFCKFAFDIAADNTNARMEIDVPADLQTADSPGVSTLDIDGDNPLVLYNGEKLESLPFNAGGLRMTLGISYLWNR